VDAAIARLMALVAKGVPPRRMAREVEVIVEAWRDGADAEALEEVRAWLDELGEQLAQGVAHAEEQLADADTSEPAEAKLAGTTLAALVATRDATLQAMTAA
jgi:hypothetical protein